MGCCVFKIGEYIEKGNCIRGIIRRVLFVNFLRVISVFTLMAGCAFKMHGYIEKGGCGRGIKRRALFVKFMSSWRYDFNSVLCL